MYYPLIKDVKFLPNHRLNILLTNGHEIIYDITPKISTARFLSLSKDSVFQKGTLSEDGVIQWGGGIELGLEEILMDISDLMPYHILNPESKSDQQTDNQIRSYNERIYRK